LINVATNESTDAVPECDRVECHLRSREESLRSDAAIAVHSENANREVIGDKLDQHIF
jgi:hypothetical protein